MPRSKADIRARFGDRLRELRLKKGLSQERLAFEARLHRTYISSAERGERNVSLVNLERLALALGVRLRDLIPEAEPAPARRAPRD
jgi:transcriptional regulator with XRE-family HTH domain